MLHYVGIPYIITISSVLEVSLIYFVNYHHCSIKPSLQNNNDIMNLASALAGNFMGVVQYNRDNIKVSKILTYCCHGITDLFLQEADDVTIDDLCDVMTNQSIGDELDRYAAVNAMFLTMQDSESLDVSYQGYVEFMKNSSWNSSAAEGGKYMCN